MSANRQFVDTNVLVYAHDRSAGEKGKRARALLERLWENHGGCISVQVLQEFFVTVTRKIAKPLDAGTAKEIVADMSHWCVHAPAADDVLAAIRIHQSTGISLWDSMIVRSAAEFGCQLIYSEDLNHGQLYEGVRVENPFVISRGDDAENELRDGRPQAASYAAGAIAAWSVGSSASWPGAPQMRG